MLRLSSCRDRGSALVEVVVVSSIVFIVVMSAISAAFEVTVAGDSARTAVRSAAVHAARHVGPEEAEVLAGPRSNARRVGDDIRVVMALDVVVRHPGGPRRIALAPSAAMPIAPFRSDRG